MRFSVVIPTFQRRQTAVRMVEALAGQSFGDFEVIVVVDGSTDGTADALTGLAVSFPLTVLEQDNSGAGAARNAGAAVARGELLLFLDDDMEAEHSLLSEHDRLQRDGADLVLGDIPLHPDSPPSLLSRGVEVWASSRRDRLTAPGAEIRVDDFLTGQCSISRRLFEELGGFDPNFTRDGLFGGEDIDFGCRVRKAGYRVVFNPAAISYQLYDVSPSDYLRRTYQAGRSDQELFTKHPELGRHVWRRPRLRTRRSLVLLGPLVYAPSCISWPLRGLAASLARMGLKARWVGRFFFAARTMEYLRGVHKTRRSLSTGRAVVLAYHAVADLQHDPVLAKYGVPVDRFTAQLDTLARRGWRFVDLDSILLALRGQSRLPRRALLVTFDDCSADLDLAAGLLADREIPAVAFAVSGRIGGTNDWDLVAGAGPLQLLDAAGLLAVSSRSVEIGSHSRSHTPLTRAPAEDLEQELCGSATEIELLGLPRPRAFSYPHGEWTPEIADAVSDAGYEVAFTVEAGVVERGGDPHVLPRVEVLAEDTPLKLRVKLSTAGWRPALRRRALRLVKATEL
jgi:GT2 family glycosyltransferase/peptidoglycan/xylan/chitin deacetylase (PgdA/CDA1 family)